MRTPIPEALDRRPKTQLRHEDIGGGKVRQGFRIGAEYMRPGTILSREQIMAMPYANRTALLHRFIEVWPLEATRAQAQAKGPSTRFIVHIGAGKYNVIEGTVLNDEPLEKHEAEDLKKRCDAEDADEDTG